MYHTRSVNAGSDAVQSDQRLISAATEPINASVGPLKMGMSASGNSRTRDEVGHEYRRCPILALPQMQIPGDQQARLQEVEH